jgi:two-component system sensor histidine kinase/response regulator
MVGSEMNIISDKLAVGKSRSLRRGLLFWFLILSLIPMSIVSLVGFYQADTKMSKLVVDRLEDSANLKVELVESWFEDRLIALNRYSTSHISSELLSSLSEGYQLSGLSLDKYTQSNECIKRIEALEGDLVSMYGHYNYIHNILLIDPSGNILYTTENT